MNMSNYRLLLIEDSEIDRTKIRATIKTWIRRNKEESSVDFVDFNLDNIESDIASSLIKTIIDEEVDSVLIDYKLLTDSNKYNGNELFNCIQNKSPLFPCVILTNNYDDCVDKKVIDQDKVYIKEVFLDTRDGKEESDKLVDSLFSNIDLNKKKIQDTENAIINMLEDSKKEGKNVFPFTKLLECNTFLNALQPSYDSDSIADSLDKKYAELFDYMNKVLEQINDKG